MPDHASFSKTALCSLAASSAVSVANVYYSQPLLDFISKDYDIPSSTIGIVVTVTQIGSVLALLFLVPLGDAVSRRWLLIVQSLCLIAALLGVCISRVWALTLFSMLLVGMMGTASTQGLIAYTASVATPNERGKLVGIVQGGVVIGLLLARTVSGAISDVMSWRVVYATSCVATIGVILVVMFVLPPEPAPVIRKNVNTLWKSSLMRLFNDRMLQIRGVIGFLLFADLNIFWAPLVLPLTGPEYNFSHTTVGAFGLVGIIGALGALRAGQLTDKGYGQKATGIVAVLLIVSWVPIYFLDTSLFLLAIGIIALDLAGQSIHVLNQTMILRGEPRAAGQLIACYMLFYAGGSGLGAITGTCAYALGGWHAVSVVGLLVAVLLCAFWRLTRSAQNAIIDVHDQSTG